MQAIADCASALKGIVAPSKDITALQHLITSASTQFNPSHLPSNMPFTPIIFQGCYHPSLTQFQG